MNFTTIRPEQTADYASVRNLNRLAFGSASEADLVDTLRSGGFVILSLVAENEGSVVGHILFSRQTIVTESGNIESVALAPMAVLPAYQRQGIGSQLVQSGLDACQQNGQRIVTVLGYPDFYVRFGFSAAKATTLKSPFGGGSAWMARELVTGALKNVTGTVEFAAPFHALR